MAPHNGGESWVGLMEIGADRRALYSVVDAGGQNLFIGPDGKGNPHLTDQTMMHETNELKKIDLSPGAIRKAAASTLTLEYRPPARYRPARIRFTALVSPEERKSDATG